MAQVSINNDPGEWGLSTDSGERARLLQSPSVDIVPKNEGETSPGGLDRGTTSTLGAVFIVVNACLGAGLLNFPAAFSTAGGVAAGIVLQMVSVRRPGGQRCSSGGESGLFASKGRLWIRDGQSVTHPSPFCHTWQTSLIYCSILSSEAR